MNEISATYCEKCNTYHSETCPKTSVKRREQNRRAQRKYRNKKKLEKTRITALEETNTYLRIQLLLKEAESANFVELIHVAGGINNLLMLVHPDKHGDNCKIANDVTRYLLKFKGAN